MPLTRQQAHNILKLGQVNESFIRMRRKTSPFTVEISGADRKAVQSMLNFRQFFETNT